MDVQLFNGIVSFWEPISTFFILKSSFNVIVEECEYSIDDHTAENGEGQEPGLWKKLLLLQRLKNWYVDPLILQLAFHTCGLKNFLFLQFWAFLFFCSLQVLLLCKVLAWSRPNSRSTFLILRFFQDLQKTKDLNTITNLFLEPVKEPQKTNTSIVKTSNKPVEEPPCSQI